MKIAGTINHWFYLLFVVFALWLAYSRVNGIRTNFSHYFFLFVFPIAAGTGLLSSARRGEFDLLFGAGTTRARLWWSALGQSWLVPAILVFGVFLLSGSPNLTELIFRLPAVLFLTGGIAFAAGLLEIRYLIGIVWLLSRLLFVTTPAALHAVVTLSKGGEMPSPATLLIMILAAPETLLESRMPIVYSVGSSLAGAAALVISFLWFAKADFGGKRS